MWAGALVGSGLFLAGKQCRYPCRRAALRLAAETGSPFLQCLAVLQLEAYRAACRQAPGRLARLAGMVWGVGPDGKESPEGLALAGAQALESLLRALGLPIRPQDAGITKLSQFKTFVKQAACAAGGDDSLLPAV